MPGSTSSAVISTPVRALQRARSRATATHHDDAERVVDRLVERGEVDALDVMAERLEQLARRRSTARTQSGALSAPSRRRVRSPMRSRPGRRADLVAERAGRRRRGVRIAGARRRRRVEHERGVAHRAGEHELVRERAPVLAEVRAERRAGAGRLQPDDAAHRRRETGSSRPCRCRARPRPCPTRPRPRLPPLEPPGRAREVPRIVRGAVGERLGGDARRELGRVGLADEHEPGARESAPRARCRRARSTAGASAAACRSGTGRPRCGTPRPSRGTARRAAAIRGAGPSARGGASARARSKRSWITALSAGFSASMRAIAASTSSAGDASPRATSSACAVASSHGRSRASSQRLAQVGARRCAARRAPDRLRPWTTPTSAGAARSAAALEPVIGQVYFSPECHAAYARARLRAEPGTARARRAARRPGVLHEPRLAARPGAAGRGRGRVRRVQARAGVGRRAARLVAHRRADDLRRAPRGRGRAARARARAGRRSASRARVGAARTRGRAARSRGPAAVRGPALVVGRSDRPVDAPVPPRRHAPRVPRRRAHLPRGRAPRSTASRSACSTTSTWGCRCAATCARAAGTTTSSTRARSGCASRGWLDGDALTDDGRDAREAIERATDRQMAPALDALGDDSRRADRAAHAVGRGDPRGRRLRRRPGRSLARSRRLTRAVAASRPAGRSASSVSFVCRGHPNVTATHDKTLELTRDADISRRATCVLGVASDARRPRAARAARAGSRSTLECDGARDAFTATISPFFLGDSSLVFRRGPGSARAHGRVRRVEDRGRRSTATSSTGCGRRERELRVTITRGRRRADAGRAVRRVAADRERRRHRPARGRGAGTGRPRARRGHAPAARARAAGRHRSRRGRRATTITTRRSGSTACSSGCGSGARVALVSDAGTPLCSDPGLRRREPGGRRGHRRCARCPGRRPRSRCSPRPGCRSTGSCSAASCPAGRPQRRQAVQRADRRSGARSCSTRPRRAWRRRWPTSRRCAPTGGCASAAR